MIETIIALVLGIALGSIATIIRLKPKVEGTAANKTIFGKVWSIWTSAYDNAHDKYPVVLFIMLGILACVGVGMALGFVAVGFRMIAG